MEKEGIGTIQCPCSKKLNPSLAQVNGKRSNVKTSKASQRDQLFSCEMEKTL